MVKNKKQDKGRNYLPIIIIAVVLVIAILSYFVFKKDNLQKEIITDNPEEKAIIDSIDEIALIEKTFREKFEIASENFTSTRNTTVDLEILELSKDGSILKGEMNFNCGRTLYYWEETLLIRLFSNAIQTDYPQYFNDPSNSEITIKGCVDEKGWLMKGIDFKKIN